MYVCIFQFYCNWKTENCRTFRLNQHVFTKFWGELLLRDWLKKTPRDLMQIRFPKISESDLKKSIEKWEEKGLDEKLF